MDSILSTEDEWDGAFGVVRAHHVEGGHLRPLAWLLVHLWGKARRSAAVWGPPGGGASRAPFERETRSAGGSTARRHVTLEPPALPE